MRLRRKVDDRARTMLTSKRVEQRAVADITLHEHMARIALKAGQVFQIARVGEACPG